MLYSELTIENFRGIEKLEIKDIKRFNLLVGRNNCGKTSVLEALFLLSGMSNPQLVTNIHLFRGLILTQDDDFSYMFRNLDFEIPIKLSSNKDINSRSLTIAPLIKDYPSYGKGEILEKEITKNTKSVTVSTSAIQVVEGLTFEFRTDKRQAFKNQISFKKGEGKLSIQYKEKFRCTFLNQSTIMSQTAKQMEGLLVQKKLDSVINVLRGIEPLISDIRMGAGDMIYIDIGKDKLFPINIMGDGIRRILAFIAVIADMKNGVLLIDEIDNGFHYTSLITLWRAIFKACKEYNVQLFATTHSYECIGAYASVYTETNPGEDDLRLIRIDRKGDQHKAYSSSAEVLKAGIEKEFEVR